LAVKEYVTGADAEHCSVKFEDTGIFLQLLPVVMADGRIHLEIEFSYREKTPDTPHLTISKQGFKTIAEMKKGQWLVFLIPHAGSSHGKGAASSRKYMLVMIRPVELP